MTRCLTNASQANLFFDRGNNSIHEQEADMVHNKRTITCFYCNPFKARTHSLVACGGAEAPPIKYNGSVLLLGGAS